MLSGNVGQALYPGELYSSIHRGDSLMLPTSVLLVAAELGDR